MKYEVLAARKQRAQNRLAETAATLGTRFEIREQLDRLQKLPRRDHQLAEMQVIEIMAEVLSEIERATSEGATSNVVALTGEVEDPAAKAVIVYWPAFLQHAVVDAFIADGITHPSQLSTMSDKELTERDKIGDKTVERLRERYPYQQPEQGEPNTTTESQVATTADVTPSDTDSDGAADASDPAGEIGEETTPS